MKKLLLLLLLLPSLAFAADTECGVDDDHNGSVDFYCGTDDQDRDGITAAAGDCDDLSDAIVPDDSNYVTTGCSGGQVRRCNANGSGWSACAAWSCDATGSGACYFVDCSTGSDAANGAVGTPWLTPKMFSHYSSGAPAGHHDPVAGDRFYLKNCTNYTTTYNPGDGTTRLFYAIADGTSTHKIKMSPYPGHTAKFAASGTTKDGAAICGLFSGASDWEVRGIEWSGCAVYAGPGTGESDRFLFRYNSVHGADGIEDDNLAGLKLQNITDMDVRWNKFWDNYDRTPTGGNHNSVHGIDIYRAAGAGVVSWNKIDATTIGNGHAIRAKHCDGSSSDQLTVQGNVALRTIPTNDTYPYSFCEHPIFEYNYYKGTFSNYQYGLYMADTGGPTNFRANGRAKYNTFIGAHGLEYQPSKEYDADGVACSGCATLGTFTFSDNVVVDTDSAYAGDEGTNEICQYGSDAYYTDIITGAKLIFSRNSYNPVSTTFKGIRFTSTSATDGVCASNPATTGAGSGATLSGFAAWQGAGYDTDGYSGSITLNSDNIATNVESSADGWNQYVAGATPTPTPTPTPAPATSTGRYSSWMN